MKKTKSNMKKTKSNMKKTKSNMNKTKSNMNKTKSNMNKKNKKSKSKSKKSSVTKTSKQNSVNYTLNTINNKSKQSTTLTSLIDFKKDKSFTILTKPSEIKSSTNIGEFYNLLEMHDNINKNCLNKVKDKEINGIKLNKPIAKKICNCLFEKNKNITIEKLEEKVNKKKQTPASSCIKILDDFIKTHKTKKQ